MVTLLLMHVTIIAKRFVMDVIESYRDAISSNGNPIFQQGESSQVCMHGNNFDVDINQAQNLELW
jgi:hypothetical protein